MGREKVLGDVRRALGRDAAVKPMVPEPPEHVEFEGDQDPGLERFQKELEQVSGFVLHAGKDWGMVIQRYVQEQGLRGVFAGPGVQANKMGIKVVDEQTARSDPEGVLGLARASWGIAHSGSVVIEGGDALLPVVLVETSLVLLDPAHLVPTLADLPPPDGRRMIVTGPARTADIEKKIVLGAHGAKRFGVVLVH